MRTKEKSEADIVKQPPCASCDTGCLYPVLSVSIEEVVLLEEFKLA